MEYSSQHAIPEDFPVKPNQKNITLPTHTKLAAKIVRWGSENGGAWIAEFTAKFARI